MILIIKLINMFIEDLLSVHSVFGQYLETANLNGYII